MEWSLLKKSFDRWEDTTAKYLEHWLKSPMMLSPSAMMLTAVMKAKATSDQVRERLWSDLGLATRRDQERTLHLLNQIQSRLLDIEEKLDRIENDRAGE